MQADPGDAIERRLIEGAAVAPTSFDFMRRRVKLIDLEGVECREPFFVETIARLERSGRRPIEIDLNRFMRAVPDRVGPDGFIFHTGRCGSTLLANMLAASGRCSVLREPGVLIDVSLAWLETDEDDQRHDLESLLPIIVPQLLWATAGGARHRILKPAAWNIQLAGLLLRIFPATPAVFLYRNPAEMVSSMLFEPPGWREWIERPRSRQACYLPSLHAIPPEAALSETTFFAHAWRSAVDAALALPPERVLFLDYADLVSDAAGSLARVLAHFSQVVDPETTPAMLAACSIYSKDPARTLRFDPGGAHRRPSLTSEEIAAVEMVVGDVASRLAARLIPSRLRRSPAPQ